MPHLADEQAEPKCPGCNESLCLMQREWDYCPNCNWPLPAEISVDFVDGRYQRLSDLRDRRP